MTYDGSINFDTRIDTGNFNQGIQATRNLITNAIEQMLQIMESTMHQIEANAAVTGQRIQAILDNISHSQNTQNREIIFDIFINFYLVFTIINIISIITNNSFVF